MDEKQIRLYAYEKMRKELEEKFKDTFTPVWSEILMNIVDAVVCGLKAKENAKECEKE